jgi:hypothetical protein
MYTLPVSFETFSAWPVFNATQGKIICGSFMVCLCGIKSSAYLQRCSPAFVFLLSVEEIVNGFDNLSKNS